MSTQAAANEIISSRVFGCAPERLFEAFRDARQLAQWWGPQDFTNTFAEFDFRPGGDWRFTMHGPDGTDYPNYSAFAEIVRNERIVFDHISAPKFRMTITLEPLPKGTLLGWRMTFESADLCARLKPICVPANEQNFDRLEALLEKTPNQTALGGSNGTS